MATLQSYSGLKNLNNAWLARLGIVFAGTVLCAVAEYLMGHHFLLTIVALACYFFGIALFVFSGILAILVYLDIDTDARDDNDEEWIQGLGTFCIIVIAILMIWVDWKWFAAIAACGSFVGPSAHTTPAWWRALFFAGIGAIIVIQLWLNTALIHLMSSGETLMINSHVETQAPLLAALGFGLGTARWASVRGTNRVAVFFIAFLVFFYGQRLAVDAWAESRSADTQNRAIASLMLANRLANSSDRGQRFLNASNLVEARIKTALLPGKLTLMGFPDEYNRYLQGNDEALLEIGVELLSHDSYLKFKPMLDDMKHYYQGYLFAELAELTDERVAQQVAQKNFPVMAGGEPLTRGAIADKIMTEIWEQTPAIYRTANGMGLALNSNRGRNKLANHLAQYQLTMPSRWRYESYEQFRELLRHVVDRRVAEIRDHLNNVAIDPAALTTDVAGTRLMQWRTFTLNHLGLALPPPTSMGSNYTYEDYQDDIRQIFSLNMGFDLAKGLYQLYSLEKKGTPAKAAIMPLVGIFASFVFIVVLICVVISKLFSLTFGFLLSPRLNKLLWPSLVMLSMLGGTFLSRGLEEGYLLWQQILYGLVVLVLHMVGLEPGFPSFIPSFLI